MNIAISVYSAINFEFEFGRIYRVAYERTKIMIIIGFPNKEARFSNKQKYSRSTQ